MDTKPFHELHKDIAIQAKKAFSRIENSEEYVDFLEVLSNQSIKKKTEESSEKVEQLFLGIKRQLKLYDSDLKNKDSQWEESLESKLNSVHRSAPYASYDRSYVEAIKWSPECSGTLATFAAWREKITDCIDDYLPLLKCLLGDKSEIIRELEKTVEEVELSLKKLFITIDEADDAISFYGVNRIIYYGINHYRGLYGDKNGLDSEMARYFCPLEIMDLDGLYSFNSDKFKLLIIKSFKQLGISINQPETKVVMEKKKRRIKLTQEEWEQKVLNAITTLQATGLDVMDITGKKIAKLIGCSESAVNKTKAWKALKNNRPKKKPKEIIVNPKDLELFVEAKNDNDSDKRDAITTNLLKDAESSRKSS